jgi:hypothetical protein
MMTKELISHHVIILEPVFDRTAISETSMCKEILGKLLNIFKFIFYIKSFKRRIKFSSLRNAGNWIVAKLKLRLQRKH